MISLRLPPFLLVGLSFSSHLWDWCPKPVHRGPGDEHTRATWNNDALWPGATAGRSPWPNGRYRLWTPAEAGFRRRIPARLRGEPDARGL